MLSHPSPSLFTFVVFGYLVTKKNLIRLVPSQIIIH